jgi:hypothetical protein
MVLLERLPISYTWIVVAAGLSAAAEQVLEYSLDDPTFQNLTLDAVARGLVVPILVVYILTHLRILKNAAVEALSSLRPAVQVSDEVYDAYAARMVRANWRTELALFSLSLAVVLGLFLGLDSELLSSTSHLPTFLPLALFVVANYVLLGWLLLSLVYCSLRQSRALHALAREPLVINVYDPANLVPFGRLSLIQSLPIVGIILVPLVLLGPPTQAGYLVIFLSVVSFFTLFVPLWGVHEQIDQAKDRTMDEIYRQLLSIQQPLLDGTPLEAASVAEMAHRAATLSKLRELIQQSPNWPFKDTAAVARAIVAVTSPLVYFVLNEIIRAFLFPMLSGAGGP